MPISVGGRRHSFTVGAGTVGLAGEHFAHPLDFVVLDRRLGAARPAVQFGQRIEHPLAGGTQHARQRVDSQLLRLSILCGLCLF
jgi:hypothetical protein